MEGRKSLCEREIIQRANSNSQSQILILKWGEKEMTGSVWGNVTDLTGKNRKVSSDGFHFLNESVKLKELGGGLPRWHSG